MNLPEGAHLTYTLGHEAWYAEANQMNHPQMNVCAGAEGGGVHWEFGVEQVELGGKQCVRVKIFSDAFAAFAQMPEFFSALAENGDGATLDTVCQMLDSLGAVDDTQRETPERYRNRRTAVSEAEAARSALTAYQHGDDGPALQILAQLAAPQS